MVELPRRSYGLGKLSSRSLPEPEGRIEAGNPKETFLAAERSRIADLDWHPDLDFMLDRRLFDEIQAETRQFTRDGFALDMQNALVEDYCSVRGVPFECKDHRGHHLWLHPPPSQVGSALRHYLAQKAHAPHTTSACILVPAWKNASYWPLVKGIPVLKQYPKGACIFRRPDGPWMRAPYKCNVYYDHAMPLPSRCNVTNADGAAATMQFEGKLRNSRVPVRLDTGADASFINARLCKDLRLPWKALHTPIEVQLAGQGHRVATMATCTVPLTLGGMNYSIPCFILDLPEHYGLLLGEDFLSRAQARPCYATGTCRIRHGKKESILTCSPMAARTSPTSPGSRTRPGPPISLSATRLRQAYDKGCKVYAVQVERLDEPPSPGFESRSVPERFSALSVEASDPVPQSGDSNSDSDDLQSGIRRLLNEYADVFPEGLPVGLPPERAVGHTIPLQPGTGPICRPMYRYSPAELAEIKRQLADYLSKEHIEPSSSPFGAPVLFVQKKDGGLRMCVDYRALNKITIANRYPLPRIDELLDQLHGARYFTSLDLQSGYHQIRIHPDDVEKTAFRTPYGLYQFKVLSFGLTNAPATFQRVMNDTFRDLLGVSVLIYLDDILVFSRSKEAHLKDLQTVLERLRQHQFYAKVSKCHFGLSELPFLGHVVSAEGVKVDPKKTASVRDWPVPQSMEDVRRFLGLAGYFRKFLAGYATRVAPMSGLLKKSTPWAWTPACVEAFAWVKTALQSAPVLALPDFTQPFEVVCDASGVGIGAVLMQNGRPVAYESRKLTPAERNYTTGEQELLAVVHALEVWRCYLEGPATVKVVTDHQPLTYLPTKAQLSRRQARWATKLARFHISWHHRSGRLNVADPLSRHPTFLLATSAGADAFLEGVRAACTNDRWLNARQPA